MRKLGRFLIGLSASIGVICSLILAGAAVEAKASSNLHIVITGNSMSPTIALGDVITIDPLRDPHLGDVMTFIHNGKKVTHRVIDLWGSFDPTGAPRLLYKTQGDHNRTPDPWVVTDRDVVGVQVPTPFITRVAHPINSRPLLLVILVAPLMMSLLANELLTIARTVKDLHNHSDVPHARADHL